MGSGVVHFGENTRDIAFAINHNHRDYQERVRQLGLTAEKKWDYFEKARECMETSGLYPNYKVVKSMPASVFGDRFGYEIQDSIYDCMTDFYAGKISENDVKDYLEECCVSMRIYRTQQCQTSGYNATDNQQIVSQVYEVFAKMNAIAARNANYNEGLAENQAYGGRTDDWVYYNSDYYYQCEETKELLRQAAGYVTDKWEIPAIDPEEIEKNTTLTLDGKLDFNSCWNWEYRNQVGGGSMEDESVVPPEGFRFFFKENSFPDYGTLWVSLNGDREDVDVPFFISRTSLKGQIYRVYDLLDDGFKAAEGHKKYSGFLSGLTVFTTWYAHESGLIDLFGNYVPQLE
ncbi:MAG: hypothetical protein K2I53_14065 [Lachnospiraceae bacterium]|nr:hypothetical protein [Lachnospiraceae bacterium]